MPSTDLAVAGDKEVAEGFCARNGRPYSAKSIRAMLAQSLDNLIHDYRTRISDDLAQAFKHLLRRAGSVWARTAQGHER